PGVGLALAVFRLREPERGRFESADDSEPTTDRPLEVLALEIAAVIPPFTLWSLKRSGAAARTLVANGVAALGSACSAWALRRLLGPPEQWIALGIGVYAAISWAQRLALRDPTAFALLVQGRAARALIAGASLMSFLTYAFMFWGAPFLLRRHGASASAVG